MDECMLVQQGCTRNMSKTLERGMVLRMVASYHMRGDVAWILGDNSLSQWNTKDRFPFYFYLGRPPNFGIPAMCTQD